MTKRPKRRSKEANVTFPLARDLNELVETMTDGGGNIVAFDPNTMPKNTNQ